MNTLTLPIFDNQLSQLELELAQLQEQIKEKRALRKAIADKQKLAIKVMAKIETALIQFEEAKEELGEAATEFKAIAIAKIKEYFGEEDTVNQESLEPSKEFIEEISTPEVLTKFPRKKTESNEFFEWQETSNPAVSSFFNVKEGKPQAVYIGSNDKAILKSVESTLMKLMPISCTIREAERLSFTHELKIIGIEDENLIGFLAGFDYSKRFAPQFRTRLPKESLKLESSNPNLKIGSTVSHNVFPYQCQIVEFDNFNSGVVEDKSGKRFEIQLSDWHLVEAKTIDGERGSRLESISNHRVDQETIELNFNTQELAVTWRQYLLDNKLASPLGLVPYKQVEKGWIVRLKTSSTNRQKIAGLDLSNFPVALVEDFNKVTREIDYLMKQLNWNKQQGKDYLLKNYGKKSRLHLSDTELLEFRDKLEFFVQQQSTNFN